MKVIIAGAGVGGLVTALMLHARGIDCEVFEQADAVRELGVGINTLPHAIKELAELGLLDRLDQVAIRTFELFYTNRFGQEIWREPRGTDAGYDVPQLSVHRGHLQGVIHQAARARLGEARIHTGHRLGAFVQDDGGVTAYFFDRHGSHRATARGDVLIGADGIHSAVREALYPNEGPARWNGSMLWRGAIEWPQFLTGRSMVIAGGMAAKLVVYPIGEGTRANHPLTNWAVLVKIAEGGAPPRKEDWSRPGRCEELMPHVQRFRIPYVDAKALIEATPEFWEYPMCDRDPLPRWTHSRVTQPLPIGRLEHSPLPAVVVVFVKAVKPFGVRPHAMYRRAAVGRIAQTTFGPTYGLPGPSLGIVAHGTRQSTREPSVALTFASAFRGTPFM
jgi:2-polyprenyl-6-methoxyphenol hydroxylase-like FAD-dependent oxidoreductase